MDKNRCHGEAEESNEQISVQQTDWMENQGTPSKTNVTDLDTSQKEAVAENANEQSSQLRLVGIREFLQLEIPKRESILYPVILTQSLNMLYGWRGTGKTHVGLGIAYAVATGSSIFGWEAPKPRPVVYLDGEMPAGALQERLKRIADAGGGEPEDHMLRLLTPDLLGDMVLPDLSRQEDQCRINSLLEAAELIIVDNLSSWVRSGRENESEDFLPIQAWMLNMRRKKKSVLNIHHSNKTGGQRGTSRKEDLLDIVLALRHPPDYKPADGAVFEMHFEKARHLHGPESSPFEAALITDPLGIQSWTIKPLEAKTYERVIELSKAGLKQNEISEELSINKSTVSRHVKRARTEGRITQK